MVEAFTHSTSSEYRRFDWIQMIGDGRRPIQSGSRSISTTNNSRFSSDEDAKPRISPFTTVWFALVQVTTTETT
jgi:hypothetical protein